MISAEQIRKSMRISHSEADEDIQRDIDACILDFRRVGINITADVSDPLVDKAIEYYVKADMNYEEKAERYTGFYEKIRDSISLCGLYKNKE